MFAMQEAIRPSSDLRNHYNEISKQCREGKEAVIITVNGRGDTVSLSYEEYKNMKSRIELLEVLAEAEDDVKNGLVFKQFVPDLEYSEIIAELREQFIEKKYACYRHEVVSKTGEIRMIVAFFTIQNKLLNGHRVLEVSVADITDYTHFPETK